MKANRFAMELCGAITAITLIGTLAIQNEWLLGITLAIFGSSLLAFILAAINYYNMRIEICEEITNLLYEINSHGNMHLYSLHKGFLPQELNLPAASALGRANAASLKLYSLQRGLFWFQRKKRKEISDIVLGIEKDFKVPLQIIEYRLYAFSMSGQDLSSFTQDTLQQYALSLYHEIDTIVDNSSYYFKMMQFSHKIGSPLIAHTKTSYSETEQQVSQNVTQQLTHLQQTKNIKKP